MALTKSALVCVRRFTVMVFGCFIFSLPAHAAAPHDAYEGEILGDLGGLRDDLKAQGITLSIDYMARVWHVADGGTKTGSNYLDNLDVRFDIDTEQLLGIEGNVAAIHITHNAGGHPNQTRIGSAIGIDNVEVPKRNVMLYELWDEQSFVDGAWSVRIGIADVNNEFMYTESGLNFLSPVQQLSQTLAQSDGNGPSSFPYTEPGVRLKYMPSDTAYMQMAAYNGSAGDVVNTNGTRMDFDGNAMLIAEAGITPGASHDSDTHPNKFALGAWMYTDRFDDLVRVNASGRAKKQRSYGVYGLSSWQFFQGDDDKYITGFFRPSMADGNTAQVAYAYEVGLQATGFVAPRPKGEIGFAWSQLINGDRYMQLQRASGVDVTRSEYAFELYYIDEIYNGITLQPDLQYIVNPGSLNTIDDVLILGLNMHFAF